MLVHCLNHTRGDRSGLKKWANNSCISDNLKDLSYLDSPCVVPVDTDWHERERSMR